MGGDTAENTMLNVGLLRKGTTVPELDTGHLRAVQYTIGIQCANYPIISYFFPWSPLVKAPTADFS
jgi:hypothetical protein